MILWGLHSMNFSPNPKQTRKSGVRAAQFLKKSRVVTDGSGFDGWAPHTKIVSQKTGVKKIPGKISPFQNSCTSLRKDKSAKSQLEVAEKTLSFSAKAILEKIQGKLNLSLFSIRGFLSVCCVPQHYHTYPSFDSFGVTPCLQSPIRMFLPRKGSFSCWYAHIRSFSSEAE